MTKFGLEIKKYTNINNLTIIYGKIKKINKKLINIWTGIRLINDDDNIDDDIIKDNKKIILAIEF